MARMIEDRRPILCKNMDHLQAVEAETRPAALSVPVTSSRAFYYRLRPSFPQRTVLLGVGAFKSTNIRCEVGP